MKMAIAMIGLCWSVLAYPFTVSMVVIGAGSFALAESLQSAVARQGMVVSAHPLATEVGRQVLKQGGNAVDAAVAMTFAISVVEPFSAGIGGGGFLLFHRESDGFIQSLDFRERAPLAARPDLYVEA
jgi:gamma-glutamyltranspeptidase/glutathione hydrolase